MKSAIKPLFYIFIFLGGSSLFLGCGDEETREMDCNAQVGSSCQLNLSSGTATFKIPNAKAGTEYLMFFISRAKFKKSKNVYNLKIKTNIFSAKPSIEEQQALSAITSRNNTGRVNYNLQNIIQPVNGRQFNIVPTSSELLDIYIPQPSDYFSKIAFGQNQSVPLIVPIPSNVTLTGRKSMFNSLDEIKPQGDYEFFLNQSDFPNISAVKEKIGIFNTCLNRVTPKVEKIVGKPLFDVDRSGTTRILFTKFPQNSVSQTVGMFSFFDRFTSQNGKRLADSNAGEIIYLDPDLSTSALCATSAHEYQHLVSFDYKVLSRMGGKSNFDIQDFYNGELQSEELSLSEGYSHIVEELTGEQQLVGTRIYDALSGLNGSTFSLDVSFSNQLDNSRTRGLSTLLLYYVIRRAGGTLSADDPITQRTIRELIQSPKIGIQNIADHFSVSEPELLEDFSKKLALALYDSSKVSEFIPPFEPGVLYSRGIKILPRNTPFEPSTLKSSTIHPYEVNIPFLDSSKSLQIPAQALVAMRLIIPSSIRTNAEIRLETSDAPFVTILVPVRYNDVHT